jgi:hypothetical protein
MGEESALYLGMAFIFVAGLVGGYCLARVKRPER